MKRRSIPMETQRAVFKRDQYKCQYCGKVARWLTKNGNGVEKLHEKKPTHHDCGVFGRDDPISFEIDHVVPIFCGGGNDLNNLKLACRGCNRSKGKGVLYG